MSEHTACGTPDCCQECPTAERPDTGSFVPPVLAKPASIVYVVEVEGRPDLYAFTTRALADQFANAACRAGAQVYHDSLTVCGEALTAHLIAQEQR